MNGGIRRFIVDVVAIIAAIALAVTFIAGGLVVCAEIPAVTEILARSTCESDLSPFTTEELTQMAVQTRAYTVADNDYDALMDTVAAINDAAETPWAQATRDQLAEADEAYTLTPDAISHLDDVYTVVIRALYILGAIGILAIILTVIVACIRGRRMLGNILLGAGCIVCVLLVIIALIAATNFSAFFSLFHMLFFESGSWVFSANSLLICMYPEGFWIGMGIIWLATSLVLSILSIVIGVILRRKTSAGRKASAQRHAQYA